MSDFNAEPFLSMIWPVILADRDTEKDLLEFRKILEEGSIRHLALKGSIDNCNQSVKLDILFHRKIFELTGNKLLMVAQNLVEYILEKTVSYNRSTAVKESGSGLIIYKQHKRIYEAVVKGDSQKAVDCMSEHLDYVQNMN